ncbi:hypothetical protein B0H11DRAFT_329401 [Mycena galericulata]|nr:hypothetical protein B0H11DRAFT_329401 [Mycena galericulata]
MTGAMIKGAVDPSVEVVITTFVLPRTGNKSWADFLDSEGGKNSGTCHARATYAHLQRPCCGLGANLRILT